MPAGYEGHSCHDQGFDVPWSIVSDSRIELHDPGDEAYPWPYFAWQELAGRGNRLQLMLGIENIGSTHMPVDWASIHGSMLPSHS